MNPPKCTAVEKGANCPNVGRYIPTVYVYWTPFGKPSQPSLQPMEIEFVHLLICRSHQNRPESLIKALWPEVMQILSQDGRIPSNFAEPFVNFRVASKKKIHAVIESSPSR